MIDIYRCLYYHYVKPLAGLLYATLFIFSLYETMGRPFICYAVFKSINFIK
jgi:hypothetical protein